MSTRGNKVVDDIQRVVDREDSSKSAIAREIRRNEQAQEEQRRNKFDALSAMSNLLLESKLGGGKDVKLISADINHMLSQREKHYKDIESTVAGDHEQLKLAQEGYAAAKHDLEVVKESIYAEIASSPIVQDLRKRVEQARDIADNAESLTEAISAETRQKLVAYKQDAIFIHLLGRQYDTDKYQGSGLWARLDAWLAKRVDYRQSLADYNMLLALPPAAKARESEVEVTHDNLKAELEAAINLIRQTHNLNGAQNKLDAASERLDLCQQHINRDQDFINSFLNKTDDMMTRIRQRTQEVISQFSIPTLERMVASTASSADDEALEKYQQAVRREKQLVEEEEKLRQDLTRAEESFRRAKQGRDMFRNRDYDRRDRKFDSSFDMNTLMVAYMSNQMSLNDLNNRCDRDSTIVRESTASSSSSFSTSSSFGSSSSSSSSSSGFSSSSSFGGDSGGFSSSSSFGGDSGGSSSDSF